MDYQEEINHLKELLSIYRKNLFKIERDEAISGISSSLHLFHEKESCKQKIKEVEERLQVLSTINQRNHVDFQKYAPAVHQQMSDYSDLVNIYPNYLSASSRFEYLYTHSKNIKILTSNGKSDLSHGSVFYNVIAENSDAKIFLLLASKNSYYISSEWALKNGVADHENKPEIWKQRIDQSILDVRRRCHNMSVYLRFHKLPFTWRIWIGDEFALLSSRFGSIKNDIRVPIYEVSRSRKPFNIGIFDMLENYFDRSWEECEE